MFKGGIKIERFYTDFSILYKYFSKDDAEMISKNISEDIEKAIKMIIDRGQEINEILKTDYVGNRSFSDTISTYIYKLDNEQYSQAEVCTIKDDSMGAEMVHFVDLICKEPLGKGERVFVEKLPFSKNNTPFKIKSIVVYDSRGVTYNPNPDEPSKIDVELVNDRISAIKYIQYTDNGGLAHRKNGKFAVYEFKHPKGDNITENDIKYSLDVEEVDLYADILELMKQKNDPYDILGIDKYIKYSDNLNRVMLTKQVHPQNVLLVYNANYIINGRYKLREDTYPNRDESVVDDRSALDMILKISEAMTSQMKALPTAEISRK